MKLPNARTENLLEQNLKNETLIYDLTIDKAFNLNETLSIIYKACGHNSTFDELKRKNKFTDDFIYLALDELKRNNLLAEDYESPFAKTNRREVIKKVGLTTMLVLPLITGLIAPKAIHAASGSNPANDSFLPLESACYNALGAPPCSTGYCANGGETIPGICCSSNTAGGKRIMLTGTSYTEVEPIPSYFLAGSPPPDSGCPTICCNGSDPVGGCTYALYEEEGYDPNEVGQEYVAYQATCNCAC
jgi:hypothetical protein